MSAHERDVATDKRPVRRIIRARTGTLSSDGKSEYHLGRSCVELAAIFLACVVTNDDLSKRVDTSDEWILAAHGHQGSGISLADGETTSMLGEKAARARQQTGVTPSDIDLVIVAHPPPTTPSLPRQRKSRRCWG